LITQHLTAFDFNCQNRKGEFQKWFELESKSTKPKKTLAVSDQQEAVVKCLISTYKYFDNLIQI